MILENGKVLFLPNAACLYLLPIKNNEIEVNNWLEFEANLLAPNLVKIFGNSSTKNPNTQKIIVTLLKKLNSAVEERNSIVGVIFVISN